MSVVDPTASFDDHGRAVPLSESEIRQRNQEAIRALDALDDIGDDDEQRETLEFLIKAIDEDRLSDRRRFL